MFGQPVEGTVEADAIEFWQALVQLRMTESPPGFEQRGEGDDPRTRLPARIQDPFVGAFGAGTGICTKTGVPELHDPATRMRHGAVTSEATSPGTSTRTISDV